MTPKQRRVLEWLLAYPRVALTVSLDGWVGWSHRWASSQARAHMMGVMAMLGGDPGQAEPRAALLDGPTPSVSRPTYLVLQRNGWLRPTRIDRYVRGYTISSDGILALRNWSVAS